MENKQATNAENKRKLSSISTHQEDSNSLMIKAKMH